MSKSVFDQKWHRQTVAAAISRAMEIRRIFLKDHGWEPRTGASGIRLWTKQVDNQLFLATEETAYELQHAELFDKAPMTLLSSSPCGDSHDTTQSAQAESLKMGSKEPQEQPRPINGWIGD